VAEWFSTVFGMVEVIKILVVFNFLVFGMVEAIKIPMSSLKVHSTIAI